jgi:AmmeMemoRadiSam system protein B
MAMRKRYLPEGWYPDEASLVERSLSSWTAHLRASGGGRAIAAIAPHAGWAFSGRLAAEAVWSLRESETVAIFGGHLPSSSPPLAAFEDGFETPLGPAKADIELRESLAAILSEEKGLPAEAPPALRPDSTPDNTVEILLPMAKSRFPKARFLWLRAPNGQAAIGLGRALAKAAAETGRKLCCLGSTDLTHYGPSYGFSPKGRGPEAEAWVREVNDRAFIDSILELDADKALRLGEERGAACSSGAAVAAMSFALEVGAKRAELIDYATSLEVRKDSSFVGYAAIAFY